MVTGNVKSTWEIAGRLSGSFTDSTKKAQTQLGALRREYRANEGELKRLEGVMRRSAAGTDAYANASKRIPGLKDELNSQAVAITDLQRETLGNARSQSQLASATGRAGSALRALSGFGIAAGTGVGIAGVAVAGLVSSLNSAGREAQQLQTLSVRGIDTDSYQRAASVMGVLTGNTEASRAAMRSAADSALTIAGRLKEDPGSISTTEHRAAPILGFDNVADFADSRQDVEGMMQTIRQEWARADEDGRLSMRWAAGQLGIQESMIDAIAEQNRVLERQAFLQAEIAAGRGGQAAVDEKKRLDAQIGRINSGLGVMTPAEIAKAERYDESMQILNQVKQDIRTDAAIAAVDAVDFVRNPARAYREGRGREGKQSPLQELGGVSQQGAQDAYRAAGDAQLGRVPGFAQGGVVPGPTGRPQLAMVHGGERVLTGRDNADLRTHLERIASSLGVGRQADRSTQHFDQRQSTDRSDRRSAGPITINNYMTIEAKMETVAQEAIDAINGVLARQFSW